MRRHRSRKTDQILWSIGYREQVEYIKTLEESKKQLERALEAMGQFLTGLDQVSLEFSKEDQVKYQTWVKVWTEDYTETRGAD